MKADCLKFSGRWCQPAVRGQTAVRKMNHNFGSSVTFHPLSGVITVWWSSLRLFLCFFMTWQISLSLCKNFFWFPVFFKLKFEWSSVCLINGKRSEMAAEFKTATILNWKQKVFKGASFTLYSSGRVNGNDDQWLIQWDRSWWVSNEDCTETCRINTVKHCKRLNPIDCR